MHIAPCTNASNSNSGGVFSRISRISAMLNSLASTTREAPILYQAVQAWAETEDAWVEMWMARPGATSRTRVNTPKSDTITASTPMDSKKIR